MNIGFHFNSDIILTDDAISTSSQSLRRSKTLENEPMFEIVKYFRLRGEVQFLK